MHTRAPEHWRAGALVYFLVWLQCCSQRIVFLHYDGYDLLSQYLLAGLLESKRTKTHLRTTDFVNFDVFCDFEWLPTLLRAQIDAKLCQTSKIL